MLQRLPSDDKLFGTVEQADDGIGTLDRQWWQRPVGDDAATVPARRKSTD